MTSSERARVRRRRRLIAAAAVVAATATGCADEQATIVPTAVSSSAPRDDTRARLLPPRSRRPAPQPARISTALVVRRMRVTEYCYEGSPTSLGKPPWVGVAAVKKVTGIPYGAHLVIAGKRYVVGDREPSFGVSDVDLYAGRGPSCERAAARFGIQHLDVQIEAAA